MRAADFDTLVVRMLGSILPFGFAINRCGRCGLLGEGVACRFGKERGQRDGRDGCEGVCCVFDGGGGVLSRHKIPPYVGNESIFNLLPEHSLGGKWELVDSLTMVGLGRHDDGTDSLESLHSIIYYYYYTLLPTIQLCVHHHSRYRQRTK